MTQEKEYLDIKEMPYSDRQIITIGPDKTALNARKSQNARSFDREAWIEGVRSAAQRSGSREGSLGVSASEKALVNNINHISAIFESRKRRQNMKETVLNTLRLGLEGRKGWQNTNENLLNILRVARTEADDLQFEPGHPRPRVLYVGNPVDARKYYTLANFHRAVFEHKFTEAVRVLMHLGAKTLTVEHIRGWSHEFAAQLSASLPRLSDNGSANFKREQKSSDDILFRATLSGCQQPEVPPDVVWQPHEKTWQLVSEGRLKHGLEEFELNVSYEDDYGIDVDLKAKVQEAGLEVGGNFMKHQSTVWKLRGTFGSA
ncbi:MULTISPECIES: hypothetical protein [Halomonadaceae]|uniref:Uncharacterized protein n=1 Tax=Vreelandella halophila TaxID=86177 RepID=A0A9X5B602_9GAMM|nr:MULTISPECIES: hypothetical protein [Halomonas]MYL28151.1 hypothetical protein [Halomonas utahensis]MYL76058.1 hypothetical protein [Halomonas sp. 22501_18_FS]